MMEEEKGIRIGSFLFESTHDVSYKSDVIKRAPGVYVVLSEPQDMLIHFMVLDVDEADDVYEAIQGNERKACWFEYAGENPVNVAVMYEPDAEKRKKIVLYIRRKYHPPCGEPVVPTDEEKEIERENLYGPTTGKFLKDTLTPRYDEE